MKGLPCDGCAYRKEIPGDAHSRCVFDWAQAPDALVAIIGDSSEHGRRRGWFTFPFNYDPIWGPDACPQRADEADAAKVAPANPLADLLSLLGGRL